MLRTLEYTAFLKEQYPYLISLSAFSTCTFTKLSQRSVEMNNLIVKKPVDSDARIWSVGDAAHFLRASSPTIYALVLRGALKAEIVSIPGRRRKWLIEAHSVKEFAKTLK